MLKVFRDNLKYLSWILWVIVVLFVLAIFLDFGSVGMGGGTPSSAAATVGGERVTMSEFQRQYRMMEGQYRQIYGEQFTPELADRLQLPLQALNSAVNQKILLAEARRLGIQATDEDVREAILEIPGVKDEKGQFIGNEAYQQFLRSNDYTATTFEQAIRDQILLQRLNDILRANLYVSDDEIEKAYREQVERAKIRYVQVSRDQFLQGQELPPAELAAYFEAHKDEYRLPEQREAAYLLVDNAKLLEQAKVDEAEVRRYYDEHPDEYKREAEVRARHILAMVNDQQSDAQALQKVQDAKARVEKGADFAAVAGEVSEDTGSKTQGGDLGYFGRGRMVKEFEDAAFDAPVGTLVGPVKSSFGYHLIRVEDRRAEGTTPFEEVRGQIRNRLGGERTQQLAEQKARQIADRLAKDKPKGPEALEALARQDPTLSYALTNRFGAQDPIAGLGRSEAFSQAASALQKGGVSQPVQVPRGWAVLYLKEIYPPRAPALAEVEPRVRLAAAKEKQERMALERLQQAKDRMAKGAGLDDVAKELGVEVKETTEFGADGTVPGIGYNPELAKAALALQTGQVGGPVADSQGAVLFQVTEKKTGDPKELAAQREETRSSVEREKLSRLLQSLIEQRRRDMGVDFNRELLESIGVTPDAPTPS